MVYGLVSQILSSYTFKVFTYGIFNLDEIEVDSLSVYGEELNSFIILGMHMSTLLLQQQVKST